MLRAAAGRPGAPRGDAHGMRARPEPWPGGPAALPPPDRPPPALRRPGSEARPARRGGPRLVLFGRPNPLKYYDTLESNGRPPSPAWSGDGAGWPAPAAPPRNAPQGARPP